MATRSMVNQLKIRKGPGIDGVKLAEFIEQQYLARRREPKQTQKYSFAPSSIGYGHGNCPRYWNFAFTGGVFTDVTDALGMAVMSNGSSGHERIQNLFRNSDILVAEEVEVKLTDPPVRGFIDVMIRWEGEVVVGEIKTTRAEAFTHRKLTNRPAANHLFQVLVYMKATGKQNGFVLYENKNTQEILVLPVTMNEKNEEFLNNTLDWMREVYRAWEAKEVPMQPWTKRNKICRECPVFDLCWSADAPKGTVKVAPLELPKK